VHVLLAQPHFLARLAQCGGADVAVRLVDRAAGKADLSGVRAKLHAPFGEEDVQPLRPGEERDQHRCRPPELRTPDRGVPRDPPADLREGYLLPLSHSTTTRAARARRYQANTA